MPIERDPESTSFDARPWGGQQRLVPLAARFARGTDAPTPENADLLAASAQPAVTRPIAAAKAPAVTRPVVINARAPRPVAAAPVPVKRPATAPVHEDPDFRSRQTVDSLPMTRVSNPVDVDTEASLPSLGNPTIMSAPVEPMTMPMLTPVPGTLPPAPSTSLPTVTMKAPDVSTDVNPAQPAFIPVVRYPAVAMQAPITMPVPAVAVSSARAPRSIPAYSVKQGRALGGFVVPHLPKVCEVFRNEDATIAVRRRPLTARSIVAIPVGAVIATVAILMIYFAQPAQAKSASSMASGAAQPHVMMVIAEPPVVMQTISAPAPVAAEPVVLAAPVAVEPVIVEAPAVETIEKTEAPSRHRSRASRHKKPRRIVAVDASTPLGDLRPDALERP